MKKNRQSLFLVSLFLGNLMEHFDKALYVCLAPFIAQHFFPGEDPIASLAMAYAIVPLGMAARPLGALVFGRVGDRKGRAKALSYSLFGMTIASLLLAGTPSYEHSGAFAPIYLALCRLFQSFCGAGETAGGGVVAVESVSARRRELVSSLYGCTTIFGYLLASAAVTVLAYSNQVEAGWRYLYLGTTVTAFTALFLRRWGKHSDAKEGSEVTRERLWVHRDAIFRIACVTGFSYACYMVALVLLNGFVPLISPLTKVDLSEMNTLLLLLDLLMLPLFGMLARRFPGNQMMKGAALTVICFGVPAFSLLPGASYATIAIIRVLFVAIGVAFSAPYYAWAAQQVPRNVRYTVVSLGDALGGQVLGGGTATFSLWLYHRYEVAAVAALYWVLLAALAWWALDRDIPCRAAL